MNFGIYAETRICPSLASLWSLSSFPRIAPVGNQLYRRLAAGSRTKSHHRPIADPHLNHAKPSGAVRAAFCRFGPTTVRSSSPGRQPNHRPTILPLPEGEGRGEGESATPIDCPRLLLNSPRTKRAGASESHAGLRADMPFSTGIISPVPWQRNP